MLLGQCGAALPPTEQHHTHTPENFIFRVTLYVLFFFKFLLLWERFLCDQTAADGIMQVVISSCWALLCDRSYV